MARITIKELQQENEELKRELEISQNWTRKKEKEETVRFNFMVSVSLKVWLDAQATQLGLSQGGFVNVCIANYKQQGEALTAMKDVSLMMDKLTKMTNDVMVIQENEKEVSKNE